MITLTTVSAMPMNQILWTLLIVGVITGLSSIVFISILFSWTVKETVDNALKLLVFAFITGASVYGIGNLVLNSSTLSQASSKIQISQWTTKNLDNGQTEIQFMTSVPTYAYLEYQNVSGDVVPIFSVSSSDKIINHSFTTTLPVNREGIIYVVVDGKKYKIN